ncbi:MAG: CopG family ribbon-helix-helix protein [Candidatus Thermoplasmatota archaeon]
MAILSISLPDDLLADADGAIASGDYKGRSEFVRAAVRDHLQNRTLASGKHIHGSITILYPHDKEARVSDVRHAFHDVVLSLMHTHCEAETCMDVLIVGGSSARVQALADTFARLRDVSRSRLVVMA